MGGDDKAKGRQTTGEPSSFLRYFLPLPLRLGVDVTVAASSANEGVATAGIAAGGITAGGVTATGIAT